MDTKKVKCVDFNGVEQYFSVEKLSFRPSVYGVLINDNQEVLMIKHRDKYCLPGGGVKISEKISDALTREILEETGLKIVSSEIVECDDSFFLVPYENKPVHAILMFFICRFEQGEVNNNNVDKFEKEYAEKPEWIKVENVMEMNNLIFPQTKKILEMVKKRR
ncbi:MAG: NUDIX domain-containing protein [Candidatus Kerfeldbacteria bacterium]|jgi:ADP-ribose pyrophosphatase YjhB (NUDIX family)